MAVIIIGYFFVILSMFFEKQYRLIMQKDYFGRAVTIGGEVILIGAWNFDAAQLRVHVLRRADRERGDTE